MLYFQGMVKIIVNYNYIKVLFAYSFSLKHNEDLLLIIDFTYYLI